MTKLTKSFQIRPLQSTDAALVSSLLRSQSPEYSRFFYAFSFDQPAIAQMLSDCRNDVYSGVFWQEKIIGIFMLRGWDEGYKIPSFGAFIDEKYCGGDLMRLTLDTAKLICKLAGAKRLMAKIHPDNISPRGAGRLGWIQTGVEELTGNVIYYMEL